MYEESEDRALKLLGANFSPESLLKSNHGRYLKVRGSITKRIYYVPFAPNRRVLLKKRFRDGLAASFCVSTDEWCPFADRALTFALYIQHDERYFLRKANSLAIIPFHYLRAGIIDSTHIFPFVVVTLGMVALFAALTDLFLTALHR